MSENILKTALTLPNCLTPSCAAFCTSCGSILVTDGVTPSVYIFSPCGCLLNELSVSAPYRYISSSLSTGNLIALGKGCQNKIIALDPCCNEIFSFTPRLNSGVIKSVSPLQDGKLLVCYRNLLAVVSLNGDVRYSVRKIDDCSTEFESAVSNSEDFIVLYTKSNVQHLEAFGQNVSKLLAVPKGVRLRNLLKCHDETVYAFGVQGYSNAFLVPVYQNGSFICEALSTLLGNGCFI